jgi:AcrR family transcriptional regulator
VIHQECPVPSLQPRPARPDRLYRGVPNSQRTAERRQRFIDAAIQRFGGDGFHATTLKSLCAEAGLTERYFYESFNNFDELLCVSYQYAAGVVMALAGAALTKAKPTPADRMRCALDAYFKAIAANPARARLLLLEIEGASVQADAVYRAQLRASADFIRFKVCAGLPDNPQNGLSPGLLATAMMGAIYQLAKEWTLSNFKLAREQLVHSALAIFVGTIAEWQKPAVPAARPRISRRKSR